VSVEKIVARCWVIRCACAVCKAEPRGDYYIDSSNYPAGHFDSAVEYATLPEARAALAALGTKRLLNEHKVYRRGWRPGFSTRCYLVRRRDSTGQDKPLYVAGSRRTARWYTPERWEAREFFSIQAATTWAKYQQRERPMSDVILRVGRRA
jgi:hypothetical protein